MSAHEEGRVTTEAVAAPSPVAQRGSVTLRPEDISPVTSRQVSWFRAFLIDYRERYRAADGLDITESPLCRHECGRFAQINGECFSCARSVS